MLSVLGLALLLALLLALVGLGPNLGLPFGYYGGCNRVVARLGGMPGVEVVEVRMHKDTTLEDFWVTLEVGGGHRVELEFLDNDRGLWLDKAARWGNEVLPTLRPEAK